MMLNRLHNTLNHIKPSHSPQLCRKFASSVESTNPNLKPLSPLRFPCSPINRFPLGENKYVKTAGCLIIGDEVLNGKTRDSNSNFFAKFCFDLGIELKRIEVIADDENEIIEASRRMVKDYDLVVTSGGIGPTHDDITYDSIAKAFDTTLEYDMECIKRMEEWQKWKYAGTKGLEQNEEQKKAKKRMALFPVGSEVLFVREDLWVPVVRMKGKLCILPGVPILFEQLLTSLSPYIPIPPTSERSMRRLIQTKIPESSIAPFLTKLQEEGNANNIKVGSYPSFQEGVVVSLIGKNKEVLDRMEALVVKELNGTVVNLR